MRNIIRAGKKWVDRVKYPQIISSIQLENQFYILQIKKSQH